MIDLHLHLDGSLNPKYIPELARLSGISLPYPEAQIKKRMSVSQDCANLGEYLEKFDLPLSLLQTTETIEHAVYRLMGDLSEAGLCYAEIRFAPQLHTTRGLTQSEAVAAAVKGLQRGEAEFGFDAGLILCCMRGENNREANLTTVYAAREHLGRGVCAIDLAGNEAAFPTEWFSDIFSQAKSENIPFTIHAGEAAGAQSVRRAVELGAARIGHGIRSVDDRELIKILREGNIYLETCYTSNLQTKAAPTPEDFPLPELLGKGVRVTLNTDNLTVSDTNLWQEYRLVRERFSLSEKELKELALNAADAAFVTDEKRLRLKAKINEAFERWLEA